MLIDRDGDSANNGTGFGKPAKDLSINFVPVPYPDYPPAAHSDEARRAAALARAQRLGHHLFESGVLISAARPQQLGIVAIDGVPLNDSGSPATPVDWGDHIGVPPGARVEFIVERTRRRACRRLFVTRTVDTGPGGENDPNRALAQHRRCAGCAGAALDCPRYAAPLPARRRCPGSADVAPVRVRKTLLLGEAARTRTIPTAPPRSTSPWTARRRRPFDPRRRPEHRGAAG